MHTTELFKNSNISAKLKPNSKYFTLFIRGPDGFQSWEEMGGRKSRDTLPLKWEQNSNTHDFLRQAPVTWKGWKGGDQPTTTMAEPYHKYRPKILKIKGPPKFEKGLHDLFEV